MKKLFAIACAVLISLTMTGPVWADSLPIITGKIFSNGLTSFSGFSLNFKELTKSQSTDVKVDSAGNFVGQVPSVGEYRVYVSSQKHCISGTFKYTVASTSQHLEFALPKSVRYEFVPKNASGKIVSNVSMSLSFPLEAIANPNIENPTFYCTRGNIVSPYSVNTPSTFIDGFEAKSGLEKLGSITYVNALAQNLALPILRNDFSSTKVEVFIPATPEILIESKSIKFKNRTVSGKLSLRMPEEFGTIITDRVISVYLRNNVGGKWGQWFIIRSMRVIPGVPASFTNNLSAYKGAQVDIGFRGSDFTSEIVYARVKVPK